MKDRKPQPGGDVGELGDISPELFREQLRRLADWIADYRENIGQRRISPNDEPGAIIARPSHGVAWKDTGPRPPPRARL